ncbi:MAG: hypothetical protein ACQESO_03960 [Bacillota bacterium]
MQEKRNSEPEKKDSISNKNEIYRRAGLKDVDDIYRIASKMQLENKPDLMSSRGFLIDHYTSHPEIKDDLEDNIFSSIFLVCETRKGILGFLHGYDSEQWLKQRPHLSGINGTKIVWIESTLNKLGISSIENFNSFGVIDKISVDKTLGKKRVAFNLIRLFAKLLLEKEKKYVMSEIVTRVYEKDKPLDIKNKASIKFHRKLGFHKVGDTEKYSYDDTFLKDKGYFKDEIYLARINDLPYQYKRIFRAIK